MNLNCIVYCETARKCRRFCVYVTVHCARRNCEELDSIFRYIKVSVSVLVDFVLGFLCRTLSEIDMVYMVVVLVGVEVEVEYGEVFLSNKLRVCSARSGEVRRGN